MHPTQDVRSRRSLGIHHATFCLTDEAMDEPARVLREVAAARGLAPAEFIATQHGFVFQAGGKVPQEKLLGAAPAAGSATGPELKAA